LNPILQKYAGLCVSAVVVFISATTNASQSRGVGRGGRGENNLKFLYHLHIFIAQGTITP
jgi:hypothetical protein